MTKIIACLFSVIFLVGCNQQDKTLDSKVKDYPYFKSHYLLYTSKKGNERSVHRLDVLTKESINISGGNGQNIMSDWSPIRNKVVFTSNRGDSFDIFEMNIDGTEQKMLVSGMGMQVFPQYSKDGKKLIYLSEEERKETSYVKSGFDWWICILDLETGKKTKFFKTRTDSNPFGVETAPKWSPDGKLITYDTGNNVLILDKNKKKKIITNFTGNRRTDPIFSPNGKQIAYSFRDFNMQLYTIDVDGKNDTQITSPDFITMFYGYLARYPSWTPDGKSLTYITAPSRDQRNSLLHISNINIKTGETILLVRDFAGESPPIWAMK